MARSIPELSPARKQGRNALFSRCKTRGRGAYFSTQVCKFLRILLKNEKLGDLGARVSRLPRPRVFGRLCGTAFHRTSLSAETGPPP